MNSADKVFYYHRPWVERLDQPQQTIPGHDLIHPGEEPFAACLLALASVFVAEKAHLAHGRLGSGGEVVFQHI